MKVLILSILSVLILLPTSEAASKEAKRSYSIARRYYKTCKNDDRVPALGNFGWAKVEAYWDAVPELRKLREEFEAAEEALLAILEQDEDFLTARTNIENAQSPEEKRELQKKYQQVKSDVFRRLSRKSAYKKARKKRNEALLKSNLKTLKYIIDDYEEREEVFPTDWIK